jgi:hypothetical protein
MRAWPAQGKSRRRPRRRSDGGVEAVAPCKAGLGRREPVGEHLNEATITWLGSIPECGNTTGQANCRYTRKMSPLAFLWPKCALDG